MRDDETAGLAKGGAGAREEGAAPPATRGVAWLPGRLAIAVGVLLAAMTVLTPAGHAQEAVQILTGFEIAPVRLNLAGKPRDMVGLGSYLVNTTGCNDCHTHPNWADGHNPYLGQSEQINAAQYLSGGRTFGLDTSVYPPVAIISANLTPDSSGRPAGLTLTQFLKVMRAGHDPDQPSRLLKVMPWPLYRWKTDRDLTAMYMYLTAIPSLPDNPSPGP